MRLAAACESLAVFELLSRTEVLSCEDSALEVVLEFAILLAILLTE
jgi:hypothetical protein